MIAEAVDLGEHVQTEGGRRLAVLRGAPFVEGAVEMPAAAPGEDAGADRLVEQIDAEIGVLLPLDIF